MRVNVNDIYLEAEVFGDEAAPTIVLIRGLGTQLVHWPTALIEGFVGTGFQVVIFDNRDVGMSARCPAPGVDASPDAILEALREGRELTPAYTVQDMADDVVGLMDALAIPRAHIFGISMGGVITQLLALNAKDRVKSATIVMSAAAGFFDRVVTEDQLPWLLARPMSEEEAVEAWVEGHEHIGSPGYPMPQADIRAEARLAYQRGPDPEGVNRQFLALLTSPDRRPMLDQVSCPTLVIHGAEDALIAPDLGREIVNHIPGARFEAVKGMGHIITPVLSPLIVDLVAEFAPRY